MKNLLVESARASGRQVKIITYHDGSVPVSATLLFKTQEDATDAAEAINNLASPKGPRRRSRGTAGAARRLDGTPPVKVGDLGECPSCGGDGYGGVDEFDAKMFGYERAKLFICKTCDGEGTLVIEERT